jgi:hypothetical protein
MPAQSRWRYAAAARPHPKSHALHGCRGTAAGPSAAPQRRRGGAAGACLSEPPRTCAAERTRRLQALCLGAPAPQDLRSKVTNGIRSRYGVCLRGAGLSGPPPGRSASASREGIFPPAALQALHTCLSHEWLPRIVPGPAGRGRSTGCGRGEGRGLDGPLPPLSLTTLNHVNLIRQCIVCGGGSGRLLLLMAARRRRPWVQVPADAGDCR